MRTWRARKADKIKGYAVYYIPNEKYIGMSKDVYGRMRKHKHLGKDIEGYKVLCTFKNPKIAHLIETLLHLIGYNGFRP